MNEDLDPSADLSAEQQPEVQQEPVKPDPASGEAGAPEVVETDEERNKKALEADAEARRVRAERKESKLNQRFAEITAEKYAEKARADALEKLLEKYSQPQGKEPNAPAEPTREQFDSYEDFVAARAEFRAEQKAQATVAEALSKFQKENESKTTAATRQSEQQQAERVFIERRTALEKELPDYREVVEEWSPDLPPTVVDLILRMPDGPRLTYHFAKNPALEAQFKNQPEALHGVLLGQLVATLNSPTKTTSTAPKPGQPVATKGAPSADGDYTGPPEGYLAWARKNLK